MLTNAPLLQLTLNTGHVALTSGITPTEELAAVQTLLKRGVPIPTRVPTRVGLARQPMEVPPSPPAKELGWLSLAQVEAVLRACPDLETQRYVALSLFAGLRPHEVESVRWEEVWRDIIVHGSKSKEPRIAPVAANLLAWLKKPAQAHGPVVTKAARRKVKALLLKLKIPLPALRTTGVLCWLALQGPEPTALQTGVSKSPGPDQLQPSISCAEAECFFGLTPD